MRTWDIGVPQTGDDTSGFGYSFVIDDPAQGAGPEFIVHYATGFVGIGTNSPQAKLDVNGTMQAGGLIKAVGGRVIENRASDPPSPAPGQIWLIVP